MPIRSGVMLALLSVVVLGCGAGCATEKAFVRFGYIVEPERGLPEGVRTLAVLPAKVGPSTDPKWSSICATMLQDLANEARELGADIEISDRRDTQVVFDEADAKAADMVAGDPGEGGKLLPVDAVILSNINVKVETHVGRQRTLAGVGLGGAGGRQWGGGGVDLRTTEVETVTRNLVVQTDFRLLNVANNQVWAQTTDERSATDRTTAGPLFGSSETEASLMPRDQIIREMVRHSAHQFISELLPRRVYIRTTVEASPNRDCRNGVCLLRGEQYKAALGAFRTALDQNGRDHQAAYGAGVACEATGEYERALSFYNQALQIEPRRQYEIARDRMKRYQDRARPRG